MMSQAHNWLSVPDLSINWAVIRVGMPEQRRTMYRLASRETDDHSGAAP
jgi:hypothetical protein